MTKITSIPFELLDIATVTRLATANKDFQERAYKEYLLRDVGTEIYDFLDSLTRDQRAVYISKISDDMSWKIIDAVHAKLKLTGNVFFMPACFPISVSIQYTYISPALIVNSNSIVDLSQAHSALLPEALVSISVQECYQKMYVACDQIALTFSGHTPEILNWTSSTIPIFIVNTLLKEIQVITEKVLTRLEPIGEETVSSGTKIHGMLMYIVDQLAGAHLFV